MDDQMLEQDLEFELEQEKAQSDVSHKYLAFTVGGQLYGITIAVITEIQQVRETISMPELPFYVKGIINLRGNVVPIIDLNLRFGKEEKPYTDRTCIIIVELGGKEAGMIVDRVLEVVTLEDEYICPPPVFGGEEHGRFVTGICKTDEGMLLVLEPLRILSDSESGFDSEG